MATNRVKTDVTAALNGVASLTIGNLSPKGDFLVTVQAVTAAGEYVAATTGTATVEVITACGTEWEPLYEADGTTPVSFDLTAAARTLTVTDSPCREIRATPASLTGATVVGIRLAVYEAE